MFFSYYPSFALLLSHAMQEIQDGHNGYHSEAEADQVASFTPRLFINCVVIYCIIAHLQYVEILHC